MVNLSRISTPNCFLIIQSLVRKLEHTNFRRLPLRSPCGEASAPALLCPSTTLACSSMVCASSTRHSLLSPSSCSPPHTTAQPPNNPKTGCKDPSIFQTVTHNIGKCHFGHMLCFAYRGLIKPSQVHGSSLCPVSFCNDVHPCLPFGRDILWHLFNYS